MSEPRNSPASSVTPQSPRRAGLSGFTSKELTLLAIALAVALIGTSAAALSRDDAAVASASAATDTSTTIAGACPTGTAGHLAAASPATQSATAAVAAGADTTGSATTTRSPSASTTSTVRRSTSTVVAKRKVTSKAVVKPVKPPTPLITVGGYVSYGQYDGAPLRWRVIDADATGFLLVSQYVLSAGAFQSDWEGRDASSYSASEVRAWLKDDFTTGAFTTQQIASLLPHSGGASAGDRVFLLSASEVKRTLPSVADRKAAPHARAGDGAVGFSGEPLTLRGAYASWWLADSAGDDFSAQIVGADGKLGSQLVYSGGVGVRPAIRIDRTKIDFTLDAAGGS